MIVLLLATAIIGAMSAVLMLLSVGLAPRALR